MMEKLNFIEAVAERDIDLLLLEELTCNEAFRRWFLSAIYGDYTRSESLVGVWHSISDGSLGESDLILLVEDINGRKKAVLIENKIDAIVQPDQDRRYKLRGESGIEKGNWDFFATCCIAPLAYLESKDLNDFDRLISYESIKEWFESQDQYRSRYKFKSHLIQEAIEQNRRGYQATPHDHVTIFWQQYWQLLKSEFPESNLNKPESVPAGSDWPVLHSEPDGEAGYLIHKWGFGAVDLTFNGLAKHIEKFKKQNENLLNEKKNLEVLATGKALSVRVNVPVLDRFGDFNQQKENARKGIQAAKKLYQLAPSFSFKREI